MSKNELDKWATLTEWLERHKAKLMWTAPMGVAKNGPIQQDCWLVGNGYAMIFYWPTSYGIYTSAPLGVGQLPDAAERLIY